LRLAAPKQGEEPIARIPPHVSVLLAALLGVPFGGFAVETYSVTRSAVEGHPTYQLLDSARHMEVRIVPDIGNLAYEFKVNRNDVIVSPSSLKTYRQERQFCCGNPILSPWANRIDKDYYFFQGKKYLLNNELGNLLLDSYQQAIHGLLVYDSRWEVVKQGASATEGAFLTSRVDFYRHPDLMAQFPFAHIIDVTYRLKDGKLEVTTEIANLGQADMPVMLGFHPYFHVDGPREDWTLSIGAATRWLLNDRAIPTGETEPIEKRLPNAREFAMGQGAVDDVFSHLARDAAGLGHIWAKGKNQKVEVVYGEEYDIAIVHSPLKANFICIEAQTGPTNAFNLNHEGKYPGLRVLKPGAVFKASFWIVPTGY
jgi:aldose 1-epimerase